MVNDVKYKVEAGFFDSIAEDRTYSADDMNRPYRRLISNGVFATPEGEPSNFLQVFSSSDGMNIKVSAGYALIGDKWFENPSDLLITISRNSELLTRIDSIIAQVDKTQAGREGSIVYRKGSASSNPVHPEINTDEDISEFRLADIVISPSCVEITQDLITDCRGSEECPWVTSLIKQVDTSTLFVQYQTWYKKTTEEAEKDLEEKKKTFEEWLVNLEKTYNDDFEKWFEEIKDQLSGDVATQLLNEINQNKKNIEQNKTDIQNSQIKISENTNSIQEYSLRYKTITISPESWIQSEEKYEYDVQDETVTSKHFIAGHPDIDNQEKMTGPGEIESYDGGYKIRIKEKPEEEVTINLSIQKANEVVV